MFETVRNKKGIERLPRDLLHGLMARFRFISYLYHDALHSAAFQSAAQIAIKVCFLSPVKIFYPISTSFPRKANPYFRIFSFGIPFAMRTAS